MDTDNQIDQDYEKPVAYDAESRPLYAHPPVVQAIAEPSQTAPAESIDDNEKSDISLETKLKHDTSAKYYPYISLKKGEYIISAVHRHPIGIVVPFTIGIILMALVLTILFNYDLFVQAFNITGPATNQSVAILPSLFFIILIAAATYVSYYVYTNNRFFITNQSVIQDVRVGLFSRKVQTTRLEDIEDVSYNQRGIIQQLFNYGSLKLSTEAGKESYRFSYVANPGEYALTLNDAIDNIKHDNQPEGD